MPLEKKLLITLSLVAIIGAALILATTQLIPNTPNQQPTTTTGWDAQTTGTTNPGDAEIQLTPRYENNQLIIRYQANTHTITLEEYDLKEITTLYAGGNQLRPQQATPMRGHHPSGEITFNTNEPESFSITIQGIGLEEIREYEWNKKITP